MNKALVKQLDAFSSLPRDLTEASPLGAVMTVVTMAVCGLLFWCELYAFTTASLESRIEMDSNEDKVLQINFDIEMFDIGCLYVTVGVWDAFGSDRLNITRNITKTNLDHEGREGHFYTETELMDLEFAKLNKELQKELDSDWGLSSDNFKHNDFDAVVEAHDITVINFYAGWCHHCKEFSPTWDSFEQEVNSGKFPVKNSGGGAANVRVLKINCVEFEETCGEQGVSAFPTVRLYKRGFAEKKSFTKYQGPRTKEALSSFLTHEASKTQQHGQSTFHEVFKEGCRLQGTVEVARVPGTLHISARHTESASLNFAFTNVSHKIHHLSFGHEGIESAYATLQRRLAERAVPSVVQNAAPLDGKTFAVTEFHQAPHHYLKVVSTRIEASGNIRIYQLTHQQRVANIARRAVPQAKISFDLAPVEVVYSGSQRRWYDFLTSVFAIVGGAFTTMAWLTGTLNTASKAFKDSVGKLG
jgi:thiol-disulfide isomerase/thioredoxin